MDNLTSKFDSIWGTKTPAAGVPTTSRADEIRKIAQESQQKSAESKPQGALQKYGMPVAEAITGGKFGQNVAQAVYTVAGGGKKMNEIQKQYFDNANTLLALANKQTDPEKKLKYSKMASEMFSDAGNVPESVIGQVRSLEQQAGDTVGLATNVASGGGLFSGAGNTALKGISNPILRGGAEGAIKGATQGAIFGAGTGAAQGMQNEGNAGEVATSALKYGAGGAVAGGVIGGVVGAIPPSIQKGKEALYGRHTLTPTAKQHILDDIAMTPGEIDPATGKTTPKFSPELSQKLRGIDLPDNPTIPELKQAINDALTPGEQKMISKRLAENIGMLNNYDKNVPDYQGIKREGGLLAPKDDLSTIQETISPKPTAKEAKLALDQGRLVKGKDATFFKAGTEDTVIPSEKDIKSAQIIKQNIPNASKMNEAKLYTALEKRTGEVAINLKPKMQSVPVTPDVSDEVTKAWGDMKSLQFDSVPATEEANLTKLQTKFESILNKQLGKEGLTMDDVWEARQTYDQSIKESVKKATSMSPESVQLQKEIWLQNRSLLTDMFNTSSNGLDDASKDAFSEMTSMYNAKEGLLSKAKIDTKVDQSKLVQLVKKHPIIATALEGVLGYGLLKQLGLKLP